MANQTLSTTPHKKQRHIDWFRVLAYTILTIGAVIAIMPLLATISISLMNVTEATSLTKALPAKPIWGNYLQAWEDAQFSRYFFNSIKVALIILAGELVFSTLAAYAFANMRFPGKNLIFGLMLATLTLPAAIMWVPNFLTVSWLGKVTPIQWIDNWPALTIPFMASAFGIFLLRQFFQQIPHELWDSAQIDGAGHLRYLLQIVIPLSKAPILVLALFSFSGSWDNLAWALLVTRQPDWRPISFGLQAFLNEAGSYVNLQLAGAVITMAPLIIAYFFIQRQFIESMTRSGLKG
jgi:ABC-type glycerol-3-phosphate transport system permease component